MAVPQENAGVGGPREGPFFIGSVIYYLAYTGAGSQEPEIWSIADPVANAFVLRDQANAPATSQWSQHAATVDGTNICTVQGESLDDGQIVFSVFDTTGPTWSGAAADFEQAAFSGNAQGISGQSDQELHCQFDLRTTGDPLVISYSHQEKDMGTDFSNIHVGSRSTTSGTGTWTHRGRVSPTAGVNYAGGRTVLGTSNITHVIFNESGNLRHRTLDSGWTLNGTNQSITTDVSFDVGSGQYTRYDQGGTIHIVIAFEDASGDVKVGKSDSAAASSASWAIEVVSDSAPGSGPVPMVTRDGTTVHVVFGDVTPSPDEALHDVQADGDTTWGTDAVVDNVTSRAPRNMSHDPYDHGTGSVIGLLLLGGGIARYQEISLASGIESGVASSAGAGAVSCVGASIFSATVSSAGAAVVAAVGAATLAARAAAIGVAAVSAVGASTHAADASSAGAGAVSTVGVTIVAGVVSSAGVGAVSGVGESTAEAVASSAGLGAVDAVGESTAEAVAASAGAGAVDAQMGAEVASAGSGAVSAVGLAISVQAGVVSSAGAGAVDAVGESTHAGVVSSAGLGAVAGVGESTAEAVASAVGVAAVDAQMGAEAVSAGAGAVSAVGLAISVQEGVASSAGAGAVSCVGASIFSATVSSAGAGAVDGVGASEHAAVASAAGLGAVDAVGASTAEAVAASAGAGAVDAQMGAEVASAGSGAVSAVGLAISIQAGAVSSAGAGVVSAVGESTAEGVVSSAGLGAVAGVGESTVEAVASAAGLGAVNALGASTVEGVVSSAGAGAVSAVGATVAGGSVAVSAGAGAVSAVGASIAEAVVSSVGVGAVAAVGAGRHAAVASAAGLAAVNAVGASTVDGVVSSAGVAAVDALGALLHSGVVSASGTSTFGAFSPNLHRIPVEEFFPWQRPVISFLAVPPGSPSKADRYKVTAVATGEWTGHEEEITWFDGLNWQYDVPVDGWFTYNKGDNTLYVFDGSAWGTVF